MRSGRSTFLSCSRAVDCTIRSLHSDATRNAKVRSTSCPLFHRLFHTVLGKTGAACGRPQHTGESVRGCPHVVHIDGAPGTRPCPHRLQPSKVAAHSRFSRPHCRLVNLVPTAYPLRFHHLFHRWARVCTMYHDTEYSRWLALRHRTGGANRAFHLALAVSTNAFGGGCLMKRQNNSIGQRRQEKHQTRGNGERGGAA